MRETATTMIKRSWLMALTDAQRILFGSVLRWTGGEESMWTDFVNIWRKEMVTTVRDRKGMTQAILVPLIIAVFYASFTPLLNKAMFERSQKPP